MKRARGTSRDKPSRDQKSLVRDEIAKHRNEVLRRCAINAFILFHLVVITIVVLPVNYAAVEKVRGLVRPYVLWTGLFQTWDMFAPDPTGVNSYIKAVVITPEHHIRVWSFPRMEELGFAERYRKERYRKFVELLPQPQNAPLWPDVARHIVASLDSQADVPVKVLLIQFQSAIYPQAGDSPDPAFTPTVFYEDYVQPAHLP